MISVHLVTASAHIVWSSSDRLRWVICWIFWSVVALLLVNHIELIIIIVCRSPPHYMHYNTGKCLTHSAHAHLRLTF